MQAVNEIFCLSTASQMKKKRKNRWRNGFIRRTKSCSNLNSKDNPNTAESGEEEEDGKLSESEDPNKMKDVECESMENDGCARAKEPTQSTAVAQNNNIPNEGQEPHNTASAEDEVVNVEIVHNNATDGHNDEESESSEAKKTEPIAEDNTGTG